MWGAGPVFVSEVPAGGGVRAWAGMLDGVVRCCDTSVEMPDVLGFLLGQGSIYVVVAFLIVAGLGVPIPEDIMLLASGILVQRGSVSYWEALALCAMGVFIGDTFIFLIARRLGARVLTVRPFRWIITPERHVKVEEMFAKYGNLIVFMGRHMAGLRAPIFAMAGIHRMPLYKFWLYDGLGLCVSAPIVIGIGYWLADNIDRAKELMQRFEFVVLTVVLCLGVGFILWRKFRRDPLLKDPS